MFEIFFGCLSVCLDASTVLELPMRKDNRRNSEMINPHLA
jgi:hypothetical protein